MKLPTFENLFEPHRDAMGVTELVEIDSSRWSKTTISIRGIDVGPRSVVVGPDGGFTYEGRRVLVYIRDQLLTSKGQKKDYRFHLSKCRTWKHMEEQGRLERFVVTDRIDGRFMVNWLDNQTRKKTEEEVEETLLVCINCIRELNWKDADFATKVERTRIQKNFSINEFFEKYGRNLIGDNPR